VRVVSIPRVSRPFPLPELRALVRAYPSALVGYSGGVDSAVLAVVLRQELGAPRVLAVVGRSPSYPAAQWAAARAVAEQFNIPLLELDTHELEDERYLANPTNRCFFCKAELWRLLIPEARARGLAVVCDGTNADDLREHRPGYAAGRAAGVRSPLAETGFTKPDVRRAARELGVPVWDAPAAPCLSSRVAYGIRITSQRLAQVEQAEAYLRSHGVTGDLRVRHHGDRASIEVEPPWIEWVGARLPAVRDHFTALGFTVVEVDPRGYRRGSLLAGRAGRA
jgi:pyridinium-3,5-biscarboxylic acid mononucleotide sulfurtransferase